MNQHLCLKWNNHTPAFMNKVKESQDEGKYSDATIACQGKYFSVHRIILSTCSDYFEEIFERIQCQHPYIVFKDIDPMEMELMLNFMYQGEVNVIQEKLPSLIRVAEALKVRGLAVPDNLISSKKSSLEKNKVTGVDNSSSANPKEFLNRSSVIQSVENASDILEECHPNDKPINFQQLKQEVEDIEGAKDEAIDTLNDNEEMNDNVTEYPNSVEEDPFKVVPQRVQSHIIPWIKSEVGSESVELLEEKEPSCTNFSSSDTLDQISASENRLISDVNTMSDGFESFSSLQANYTVPATPNKKYGKYSWISRYKRLDCSNSFFYQCPQCDYKSYLKGNFTKHLRFKHVGERPFPCPLCPLRCSLKTDLQRHMRTHTGEKLFQCQYCYKKFTRKDILKCHLNRKSKCYEQQISKN